MSGGGTGLAMIRLRHAAIVPLAALLIAGCGGDDAPSKDEFVKAADEVCKDLDRQSQELQRSEPDNVQEIVEFARKARETTQEAVRRIRELEVPEGADGDKAQAWQEAVTAEAENQLLPALDDLEKAAEANNERALVAAAQRIDQLEATRSDKLANELGMKECGNSA